MKLKIVNILLFTTLCIFLHSNEVSFQIWGLNSENQLIQNKISFEKVKELNIISETHNLEVNLDKVFVSPQMDFVIYTVDVPWKQLLFRYDIIDKSSELIYDPDPTNRYKDSYLESMGFDGIGHGTRFNNFKFINNKTAVFTTYVLFDDGAYPLRNLFELKDNNINKIKDDGEFFDKFVVLNEQQLLVSSYNSVYIYTLNDEELEKIWGFEPIITYSEFQFLPEIKISDEFFYTIIPYKDPSIKREMKVVQFNKEGSEILAELENVKWFKDFEFSPEANYLIYGFDSDSINLFDINNKIAVKYDDGDESNKYLGMNKFTNQFIYHKNKDIYYGNTGENPKKVETVINGFKVNSVYSLNDEALVFEVGKKDKPKSYYLNGNGKDKMIRTPSIIKTLLIQ